MVGDQELQQGAAPLPGVGHDAVPVDLEHLEGGSTRVRGILEAYEPEPIAKALFCPFSHPVPVLTGRVALPATIFSGDWGRGDVTGPLTNGTHEGRSHSAGDRRPLSGYSYRSGRPPALRLWPTVMVGGVAWAQHRGIDRVQVRVDDGPWRDVDLATEANIGTWRPWSFPWKATSGSQALTVRATERGGQVQTERRTGTVPDRASGWPSVVVTID